MTKKKRNVLIIGVVCLVVIVAVVLGIVFGGNDPDVNPTDGTQNKYPVHYTVRILSNGGMALEGVGVYVYEDSTLEELVWFANTNAEGEMSFTDAESGSYVAVLSNVPTGYAVNAYYPLTGETTEIVLSAGTMNEEDMSNIAYKLGDVMMDFTVTAVDGTEYTLSELLQEKDAVVLNFWYLNCAPCRMEFPYLQEAYEEYGGRIEVLALNPVDGDDESIAAFATELGLTFPMAKADSEWAQIMQLSAYPTTVVVDRYGMITLIHKGSIDNAQTFKDVFAYFSADDYQQSLVQSITDIETVAEEGSEENPTQLGGVTNFQVTLAPGQVYYTELYKVNEMYLQIYSSDAYVLFNNKTYTPSGGVVSVLLNVADTNSGAYVGIGNAGSKEQTFTVYLVPKGGTFSNPYTMSLGELSIYAEAGNDQGVHYTYTAAEDGILTVECISSSVSNYGFYLYNLNSYKMINLEHTSASDGNSLSIEVRKGQRIMLCASAMPDESYNYPAASFKYRVSFAAGELEEIEQIEKVGYAVTVTDENRDPVSGINVKFSGADEASAVTDENGVASVWLPKGEYTASLIVPKGYTANTTQVKLTDTVPARAVKLDTVLDTSLTYTVRVVDETGAAVPNVLVAIGTVYGSTDESGYFHVTLDDGSYSAIIGIPGGYGASGTVFPFAEGTSYQNIVLTKGGTTEQSGIAYTVNVVDGNGNPMSGTLAIFMQGDMPVALAEVDAEGCATAYLEAGDYTVTLVSASGSGLDYDAAQAVLSAETTAITIAVTVEIDAADYETAYWGNYYKISAGTIKADLTNSINSYVSGSTENRMYGFYPSLPGVYRISASEGAVVNYWGSVSYLSGPIYTSDNAEGFFEITVKSGEFDNSNQPVFVIGVSADAGVDSAEISIVRTGDVTGDLPTVTYEATTAPSAFKLSEAGTLTYVDLTGTASISKGGDGYYYMNGKKLYMDLGPNAKPISMYTMLGIDSSFGAGLKGKLYDESGEASAVEDFTQCMIDHINCRDSASGVYPLTDDLIYMIRSAGEYMHWWDSESPNYLFDDYGSLNTDIAWMFAVCYFG